MYLYYHCYLTILSLLLQSSHDDHIHIVSSDNVVVVPITLLQLQQ